MNRWAAALRLIGVGWFVGISILLGVFAGLWLDGRFGTKPLFVVVGLIFGVIIAFYGVYRMILPNINRKRSKGKS